ncbi:hypothetical protein BKA56DRAFT_597640 [Ilyonectria sp. MPI-CAGE-AT-0026]|nr:hypothetical protein BKA56DRAFT_597640 [Ilyonectria sp. MPI-CAGE-AT-0026]
MKRKLAKKLATILSLEMAGAYDNINRTKLLDVLIEKNIPWWIVRFIHSFLSMGVQVTRSTD